MGNLGYLLMVDGCFKLIENRAIAPLNFNIGDLRNRVG